MTASPTSSSASGTSRTSRAISIPIRTVPPVLYVYRTVRNKKAPGGAEFVPELVHNRSGVGSQVLAVDLNKDGAIDIVNSTTQGAFVFFGTRTKGKMTVR